MPNTIPQDQNSQRSIDRLAAQRLIYAHAKLLAGVQAALAVPAPLAWAIVAAIWPATTVWAAFWGITSSLLDALLLEPLIDSRKRDAARIQELFDSELLHLPWSQLVADDPPDPELILASASANRSPNVRDLADWYSPAVGELPLPQARLICQRTNLWWDVELRRRIAAWLTGILVSVALVVTVVGLARDHSLRHFVLAVLAPLSPAVLLGLRHVRDQRRALHTAKRFKRHVEDVWKRTLSGELSDEAAAQESRRLQDVIFQHRSRAPLIFDWVYRALRPNRQAQMLAGVAELVAKALRLGS
jgi:hypothetical protein